MYLIEGHDINSIYFDTVNMVMLDGKEVLKEGRKIREIYNCCFKIENPLEGILLASGRYYNPAFLVAETIWNLTGDTNDWICDYNELYRSYFTNGKLFSGYGNRILNWDCQTNQFDLVATRLTEEPVSQHANITIFNPTYDLRNPKFVPCITNLKFRIRDNELHMSSFMRAQDMWLGFPYDINLLLTIFQLMSNRLGIKMGSYHHYCDVLRVYEVNFMGIKGLKKKDYIANKNIELEGKCDFKKLAYYRDLIKVIPSGFLDMISDEPNYWQNSLKACYSYKLIRQNDYKQALQVISSITNGFRDQFEIWAMHYCKDLYI